MGARGSPLGPGPLSVSERSENVIQSISDLWLLMTVFFSEDVFADNLFLAMIVLLTIFGSIYIFMWFFDKETWGIV